MNIPIEILAIGGVAFIGFVWAIWNFLTTMRARKKYSKENDKGKESGKEHGGNGKVSGGNEKSGSREPNIEGSEQLEPGQQLPIPSSVPTRKNRKSSRGLFRRRRKS